VKTIENIQKKIIVDFLVKKVEKSLKPAEGYSKIDKKSAKILLEMNGYENIPKRGLELYFREDPTKEVIVNDALLGRYETDIDDVVLRKSPKLKEMISFKNAKKILSDSDVLKSVKEETLDYLRTSFIKTLDFSGLDKGFFLKELKILFEADDFEGFFKLVLSGFEVASLKYFPFLSKKYGYYIFGRKTYKEKDSFFSYIGLLDKNKKIFLFAKDEIKEKDFDEILLEKREDKVFSSGIKAILEVGDLIENSEPYSPFETNLFLEGLPDELNF